MGIAFHFYPVLGFVLARALLRALVRPLIQLTLSANYAVVLPALTAVDNLLKIFELHIRTVGNEPTLPMYEFDILSICIRLGVGGAGFLFYYLTSSAYIDKQLKKVHLRVNLS